MSVPVYRRKESRTDYLNLIFDLNIKIGEIVGNAPSKYLHSYGDHLIRAGCEAMKYAQMANRVYMSKNTKPDDYKLRRDCLLRVRGIIDNISTISCIYLELSLKSKIKKVDIYKRQQAMGTMCSTIIQKINGVMSYDNRIMNQHNIKTNDDYK